MTTASLPTTRIPGPAGAPFIGSMLDLLRNPLSTYLRAHREYGDVVQLTVGPPGLRRHLYMVFSAEGAQQVLATDAANFRKDNAFYQEVRESLGNGLLTSQDAAYLRQRRLIQPLFTRRRVDGYARAITAEIEATSANWRDAPENTVDLVTEMHRVALRIVAGILFGTDIETAIGVVERTFPQLSAYALRRGMLPANLPRHWPTPSNRRAAAASAELYGVCDDIIAQRRAEGRAPEDDQDGGGQRVEGEQGDGRGQRGRRDEGEEGEDLLTLLIRAESAEDGRLDAAELRDQVLVFLLAGHETTATSLAFALHLLALHPEVQDRARAEIVGVLGDRTPTAADTQALPYLTMVLKEAMRLYPAAPVVSRRSVAATEIGGHLIPAGADVLVSPWVTHRHPAYWPQPQRFDPERFAPEAEAARPRYAWFPFGGGPRACIGQHFSMLEAVLILAVLLRDHRLTAVDRKVSLGTAITLQSHSPVRCRVASVR
jgi:cytochrome P450